MSGDDPKFTQTIDISMRLCLDAEQNVYVDNWQVKNKRPHGSVGSVGGSQTGWTAPESRKARECWGVFCGDHVRLFGGMDEAIANSSRVFSEDQIVHFREVLPEDGK